MEERLQNIIARAGVASRRGAAELVESGAVTVDGVVVREPGMRPAEGAVVRVHGRRVGARERTQWKAPRTPKRTFLTFLMSAS